MEIGQIVEKNLVLMSDSKIGMRKILDNESIGGNAGAWEGFSCYAANFYYDFSTGEIAQFWTGPVPPRATHLAEGLFRLALKINFNPTSFHDRIVECYAGNLTEIGRDVLIRTTELYNEKNSFPYDGNLQELVFR